MNAIPRRQYEHEIGQTRSRRMAWWRQARFGMFVHYGLYSILGRHEWVMANECIPKAEYEQLADQFHPEPGCARQWARLAKQAGMQYVVLTTKHHEGFCLWDSRQTQYNSVQRGPGRDLVAEFVEACRAEGLGVGLYYSLMDWHHPDGGACVYEPEARRRFIKYTHELVRELMTNYGRIDILFYDLPQPMVTAEGWESDALNQMVRCLQPNILINDRSMLPEDFSTPEGAVVARQTSEGRGWEACLTFNGLSWGHLIGGEVDAWRCRDIVKMLGKASNSPGNLLLNIGPTPPGDVPADALEPLQAAGRWLHQHGEAVYGDLDPGQSRRPRVGQTSRKGSRVYFWRYVWAGTEQGLGGYASKLESVTCLTTGQQIDFEQEGYRILLKNLPEQCPDPEAGVVLFALDFAQEPVFEVLPTTPAFVVGTGF